MIFQFTLFVFQINLIMELHQVILLVCSTVFMSVESVMFNLEPNGR